MGKWEDIIEVERKEETADQFVIYEFPSVQTHTLHDGRYALPPPVI